MEVKLPTKAERTITSRGKGIKVITKTKFLKREHIEDIELPISCPAQEQGTWCEDHQEVREPFGAEVFSRNIQRQMADFALSNRSRNRGNRGKK